ncbi:unnamed protein product [Parnassius mnemosyne]
MPDGNGVPHLVDLHEQLDDDFLRIKNDTDNQYWLYTRSNPTSAQLIIHGDKDTIWNSNYDGNKPLQVVVHGWNSDVNSYMNPLITSAFLAVLDTNVIVVDWSTLANSNYFSATYGLPNVGQDLGNFLNWLIETAGGDWDHVHLVGFSLGAHVVGIAGRTTGGKPARVSGLDPAGPLWYGNKNALNTDSGKYVESVHTDGGFLGMFDPISHVDFYPNGGTNPQPGCWISTCSHSRSVELFASSVRTDQFIGRLCNNTTALKNHQCTGSTFNMGNSEVTKRG